MNDSVKPERLSVADRLATLPPEAQQLFAGDEHEHGTPDNISKAGCLALAKLGKEAWNAWREAFPVTGQFTGWKNTGDLVNLEQHKPGSGSLRNGLTNYANFYKYDFSNDPDAIDFSGFKFGDGADFSQAVWGRSLKNLRSYKPANFSNARWGEHANFGMSQWSDEACFSGASWGSSTEFIGTQWGNDADFKNAKWGDDADFTGAQWGHHADFTNGSWGCGTKFVGAQWGDDAKFINGQFGGDIKFTASSLEMLKQYFKGNFSEAIVESAANRGATPDNFRAVDFSGAKFSGRVDFSDRKFEQSTRFNNVKFLFVPIFHGCKLHQDTSFDGAEFPSIDDNAGGNDAARAYRTLKLSFSGQQAVREEQRFFRLEMAEEAKNSGKTQCLYCLYRVFSDYGFSLWRPFVAFLVLLLAFAQVYGLYDASVQSCWPGEAACEIQRTWLNFSLSQSMPLPGFDKQVLSENSIGKAVPICFIAIHKVLAFILSFLIGLALRNLFRLK